MFHRAPAFTYFFATLESVILLFLFELFILFVVSRHLTSELSYLFYSIFRSHKIATWLMAILFVPGTIIHEFSHAIMAKLLFVYVGHMELMPQQHGESLKLGSVEVGKTDIIRNFLIGIAPFLIGTTILLFTLYYSFSNKLYDFNIISVLVLLFIFIVANTMYSSKKDMEGAIEFLILIFVPVSFLYFIGIRIPGFTWEYVNSGAVGEFFKMSSIYLGVPLIIDIALIVFSRIIRR